VPVPTNNVPSLLMVVRVQTEVEADRRWQYRPRYHTGRKNKRCGDNRCFLRPHRRAPDTSDQGSPVSGA
jgi:hypothetical protein